MALCLLTGTTSLWAAATFWKVSANTSVTADQTYVSISSLTVVSTSAGYLDSYSYTYSDIGAAVSKSIRVRSAEAPSTTSPSGTDYIGTDQSGATRLVLTVTSEVNVAFYYRRQADGGASSNCTYTENNGKDLLIVNQDAPTTYLTGTMTKESDCTTSNTYGHVKKAYTLAAGTYTVYALGTTIQLNAIFYDDGRHTETFDFATLGNTYANGTMNDGFKWFTFDGPYTLTDNAVNNKDVTDLYKIENVGNEDKSVIGRYVNGRIAIQKNTGNSGSPWLRNNGNGIQSNGKKITGYLALYGLSAGDDITITGSNWNLCSGNVSASAGGSAVESLTTETKYYVLNSNPILLYQGDYPQIKKVVINTKTDLLSNLSATSAVSGANRVLTVSPSFSTADDAVMKSYYTTDGTTPTTSSTEVTNNQITISSNSTVKIVGANTKKGSLSNVVSMDVTTGEVTLNNPVIAFTGMTGTNGLYVPTYSISEDNSDKEGTPIATLSATFNGENVDISSGTFQPNGKGTLVVTAAATGYTSASSEQFVYGAYTCQSTPNFNEIALADLGTTLGGTWEIETATRWASWSTTGGINADLTPNGGTSYYPAKLTSGGSVTIGNWFKVNRNRGSSTLRALAGYGLGDSQYAATFEILKPEEGAIVEYAIGRNTPSVGYYLMTADDAKLESKSFSFGTAAYVIKYCKFYTVASASKTISSAGWATLYTPYALDFSSATPEGLKAYTATLNGNTVTLTEVQDVPAGTGVVLKSSTTGENVNYSIPVIASSTNDDKGSMVGYTSDTHLDANTAYILGINNTTGKAQFFINNAGTIAAGKAYLPVGTNTAKALSVVFADDMTGITNTNAAEEIAQPAKRIVNGQLVIEKNGKRYNAAGAEF